MTRAEEEDYCWEWFDYDGMRDRYWVVMWSHLQVIAHQAEEGENE